MVVDWMVECFEMFDMCMFVIVVIVCDWSFSKVGFGCVCDLDGWFVDDYV